VSEFDSQSLSDAYRFDGFDCGKEPLNDWLGSQARRAQVAGTAKTFVWTLPRDCQVVAYFSIAPTQVIRSDLPSARLAGGYSLIPGYLLARLALARSLHGQGLGQQLLLDALSRIVEAAGRGGGRLVVVDAIDESAHAFYRRHDFVSVTGSQRLYLKIETARLALDKSP
jgi:GNAT superfamily N-acetyltransferase